eukprot:scaffold10675_cov121-Isochrysis_galbana.AAC.1
MLGYHPSPPPPCSPWTAPPSPSSHLTSPPSPLSGAGCGRHYPGRPDRLGQDAGLPCSHCAGSPSGGRDGRTHTHGNGAGTCGVTDVRVGATGAGTVCRGVVV